MYMILYLINLFLGGGAPPPPPPPMPALKKSDSGDPLGGLAGALQVGSHFYFQRPTKPGIFIRMETLPAP